MKINYQDHGKTATITLYYSLFTAWRVRHALRAMPWRLLVNSSGLIFRKTVINGTCIEMLRAYKILSAEVRRG